MLWVECHSSSTNVAALLKHSDAESSDSSQRIVPAASAQPRIASRRISGCSCGTPSRAACLALNSRDIVLSPGPFCCGVNGVVKSQRIPRSLQKSTERKNTVQILCVIVSAERVWDSHICHEAFHNRSKTVRAPFARAVRPLSTRGAVDEHHNVPRPPERSWVRSSSVDVDITPIPLSTGSHTISLSLSVHSHRRGQGKRESG